LSAILAEPEILKQLGWTLEVNDAILLFLSEGGDPDGDQAILAERQAETRVRGDFEEKLAVAPEIGELILPRLSQRQTAKDERPGVV
jgi:hypothetical protein